MSNLHLLRRELGILAASAVFTLMSIATATAASLTVSQGGWSSSTQVTINWSATGLASGAWIGVYAVGSADTGYLTSKSVSGTSGVVSFGLLANGNYEARLFGDGFYGQKLATLPFSIATPTGSLSLSSSAVKVGASIGVTWQSQPGITASGWVGLYTPDATDTNYVISIPYQYVTEGTSGKLTFTAPNTAGNYQFRLFADFGFTVKIATASFSVADAVGNLLASKSSYASGETVTLTWTADTALPDGSWIVIYTPGADDRNYLTYKSVTAGSSGSAAFVGLASGNYEARLFGDSGYAKRIASASFSIAGSPSTATSGADCLFNWAERTLPQYFAPVGATSVTLAPYYYRYYSATRNYLATSSADNHIWVLGASFGASPLDVGPMADFLKTAGCAQ